LLAVLTFIWGCQSEQQDSSAKDSLSRMQRASIQVKGHPFEVWLALSAEEQQRGLMQTPEAELAPLPDGTQRGMLFIFPAERLLAFWMYSTIIPLDIIYIRGDGQIVRKYTMAPFETRLYPSVEPALMALEMRAGLLDELGVKPGDHVEIPESLLKPAP
jgi:uncharacterized membrane protein (UPF0127 family)